MPSRQEGEGLPTAYGAAGVEAKWYERWEQAGLFHPDASDAKPNFTITIPPPNITGRLHMGHALCYPTQDMIARYKRLRGFSVLVLPGQDHAGIATQSLVAKQLRAEGVTAIEIGRDAFVERVWQWREESGNEILGQFRRLGCAFDWSRLHFTLDDAYSKAVTAAFVAWFERGVIYRGKRVVNWDPALRTSVSDIETERVIRKDNLYKIRYPFLDNSGGIVIATTRPETMLADVAVAVHPDDDRYKGVIGKLLRLPLTDRSIPIIADQYADPKFGTGAVKITPAHDANDFEVGLRQGLPMPTCIDDRGRICAPGPYEELDRFEARKRIVADLQEAGHLVGAEKRDVPLLVSERSHEPIEPLLSEQWFAKQTALAEPAIEAVQSSKIVFHPTRYEKVYTDWMENIRDWCISRQLWWGHRIPVYYDSDGNYFAGASIEDAQAKSANEIVRQDDDVLDTWFSSGLWPLATLGWPEQTPDLNQRYPTSLLVTDRNIIYLWVARMAMMGLDFTGKVPFDNVYIHATVLTESGQRMSKSLGTGVDPAGPIEKYGADALRYALLAQTGSNQDIRYSDCRVEEARNLCNKLWNAARFLLLNLEGYELQPPEDLADEDRWLLSRLAACEEEVRAAYEGYDSQRATQAMYQFFWSEYCDWYIERSKARLANAELRQAPRWVLTTALEAFLKMISPIMPHIAEEIYSHLPSAEGLLMASAWPDIPAGWRDAQIEERVESWIEVTREMRALRAELGIPALKRIPTARFEGDLGGGEQFVSDQAWIEDLQSGEPEGRAIASHVRGVRLFVPITGEIDEEAQISRLTTERVKLDKELDSVRKRLASDGFVQKAAQEAIQKQRERETELASRSRVIEERLRALQTS